eukprot:scaffold530_cov107-Cylindrotheca_fusiformis.AAC.9
MKNFTLIVLQVLLLVGIATAFTSPPHLDVFASQQCRTTPAFLCPHEGEQLVMAFNNALSAEDDNDSQNQQIQDPVQAVMTLEPTVGIVQRIKMYLGGAFSKASNES